MSKRVTRVSAMCAAALMAANMGAIVPASAADTTYTPVAGTSTTFQKALIMDDKANVPTITFEYAVAPGAAIAAASGKMEVIKPGTDTGVTGTPTIDTAVYKPGDATVTSADGVTVASGKKAALKTLTVNFANVKFSEPGVYRYLITETSAGQQGVAYDTQKGASTTTAKQRVLDVYVTDDNGSLVVSSYAIHDKVGDVLAGTNMGSSNVDAANARLADKSYGFVNEYSTYDLTISNAVSGNQASRDKYFKYEVKISNAGGKMAMDVDWSGAANAQDPAKSIATVYAANDMKTANNADDSAGAAGLSGNQWVTNADGSVTKTIYLKHGQSIKIKGLVAGTKYTITETPEDYKCSADGNKIESAAAGMSANATAAFTNTRAGNVPTGIMMTLAPFVGLTGTAAAGIAVIAKKKKKSE